MEQEQGEASQAKKKGINKWWIIGGIGCAAVALLACVIIVVIVFVMGNAVVNTTNKSDRAAAMVVLRNAVMDAEQFAADGDGTYGGMAAGDLKDIDSSITWVDGDPGTGQVGVIEAGQDTFTFKYKDDTGAAYQVVRKSDGTAKYTDDSGKAL